MKSRIFTIFVLFLTSQTVLGSTQFQGGGGGGSGGYNGAGQSVERSSVAPGSNSSLDKRFSLPVASGIAMPSNVTSLFQNPAGLTYNNNSKVLAVLGGNAADLKSPNYGGYFYTGNKTLSMGFGYQSAGSIWNNGKINAGVGFFFKELNSSFGVSSYQIEKKFYTNLGYLFNPFGKLKVGLTGLGIDESGAKTYALGLAYDLGYTLSLALDTGVNYKFKDAMVTPGVKVNSGNLAFSAGYSIKADKIRSTPPHITNGAQVGITYWIIKALSMDLYYRHQNKYNLDLAFRF